MYRLLQRFILAVTLGCSLAVSAQNKQPTVDTDINQRLETARQRLEQAARDVAELSGQTTGAQFFGLFNGRPFGQRKAMLGIVIEGVHDDGKSDGVMITGVSPGGPADKAGLKTGDLLTSLNGESLAGSSSSDSSENLLRKMETIEPGAKVTVEYLRNGKSAKTAIESVTMQPPGFNYAYGNGDFNIRVPGPNGPMPGQRMFFRLARQWGDLELVELSPGLGKYFGSKEGVLVVHAPRDGKLQLADGDVILNIDGRKPNDPNHALGILRSYAPGEKLTMEIMREQHRQKLEVTVPADQGDDSAFMAAPAGVAPLPPGTPMPAQPATVHARAKLKLDI